MVDGKMLLSMDKEGLRRIGVEFDYQLETLLEVPVSPREASAGKLLSRVLAPAGD